MNITQLIEKHTIKTPSQIALIHKKNETITYEQLNNLSTKAAKLFIEHQLKAGDGVLIFIPFSIDLYIILMAIFRLNLVAIFIDPYAGLNNIKQCCQSFPPKAIIASPKTLALGMFFKEIRDIPIKLTYGNSFYKSMDFNFRNHTSSYDQILKTDKNTAALVTFTSGSTGIPKAILRTHDFLYNQHQILAKALNTKSSERILTSLPMFILSHLASGATTILPDANIAKPASISPQPIISQIQKWQVTTMITSPAFIERIVNHLNQNKLELPLISKVFTGGAAVFPNLLDQIHKQISKADIFTVYGSSEAEPIAHIERRECSKEDLIAMKEGRGLLVGKPIPDINLKVIPITDKPLGSYSHSQFERIYLKNNEWGEIVVQGAHVLTGYYKGLGDKENKITVGNTIWHRTGDAGFLDDNGRIWLLGRCKALIKNELQISPFAVECALSWNTIIKRSALISINNHILLFLECKKNNNIPKLISEVQSYLSWVPLDSIHIISKIPVDKRHNGKIDYPAIIKIANNLIKK